MDPFLGFGAAPRRFTPPYVCSNAVYALSAAKLPYFLSTMSLADLKTHLKLVEDLPTDLTTGWRLQELYQREIDWTRVDNEIVREYLKNDAKLKFFNAVTVAILPLGEDGALQGVYPDTLAGARTWPDNIPNDPNVVKRIDVGPVEIFQHHSKSLSWLRWDTDRAIAAVIDGQHRVAALRRFADQPLDSVQLQTQVPVIFLVLDPRAGFDPTKVALSDATQESTLLRVVRELFIDLNKHAHEVSRARQILMDDRDVAAIGVRALLAERAVHYDPSERRLPLGVVDWQSDKAKFEVGPFITTVVMLKICLTEMLAIDAPKDPTLAEEVDAFVESVEGALGIDDAIRRNPTLFQGLSPLKTYVEKEYKQDGRPLSGLPTRYLKVVEFSFRERWKPFLERIFLDFVPYKTVIELADKHGALTGEWARVAALPKRARDAYFEKEQGSKEKLVDNPKAELDAYKAEKWPFFGVFQKGMMTATAHLIRHLDVFSKPGSDLAQRRLSLAAEWVDFLNYMETRGLMKVKARIGNSTSFVWGGIALTVEDTDHVRVKWSGPAVNGIAGLLLVLFMRRRDNRKRTSSFLKALQNPDNADKYPKFGGKTGQPGKTTWLGRVIAGVEAQLKAEGAALVGNAVQERLLKLIDQVEPAQATDDAADQEAPLAIATPLNAPEPDAEEDAM